MPFRGLNIALYFCRVCAAIDVYICHSGHSEKFEGVFDEGSIG